MDTNKPITIYTAPWIDIRAVKDLLNHHLLKYKVIYVDDDLFRDVKNALPVIDIDGKYYYNPTAETIRKIFGFTKDPDTNYVDLLLIGDSLENFLALDYAIKKNIDVAWITRSIAHLELYRQAYQRTFKLYDPNIYAYIHLGNPVLFSVTTNRKYLEYETDTMTVYAKTALITLDENIQKLDVPNESEKKIPYVYYNRLSLMREVQTRFTHAGGSTSPMRRIFVIAGDMPDILDEALRVHKSITEMVPTLDFEIIVLSTHKLNTKSFEYKRFLRLEKNMRLIPEVHISKLSYNKILRKVIVTTNMITYNANFIYVYNKPKLNSKYFQHALALDYDGYLKADQTGKTLFGNIYTLRALGKYNHISQIQLLDLYMKTAGCINALDAFLLNH